MNPDLLLSKFSKPNIVTDYVSRTSLIDPLNKGYNFILVSAPSGYGKSCLVSNWVSKSLQSSVWYSLEKSDNELYQFCLNLIAGVKAKFYSFANDIEKYLHGAQSPDPVELSNALINELCELDTPINLVLDDYHLISDEHIHEFIMLLMKFSCDKCKLIIITRFDPPFPLIEWRSKGVMIEFRSSDLQLNNTEINELLNSSLGESNEIINNKVAQLTEGWVSGIRLLTYGVKGTSELSEKIDNLAKSKTSYFHELVNQSLNQQTSEMKELILKSALLPSFSADLLNHLGDTDAGNQLIKVLRSSNLFIIELDGVQEWFRYHHLFQESLLVESYNYFEKAEIDSYHLKIADWYAQNGFFSKAIEFYLKGDNHEKAFEIFKVLRISLLNSGNWAELHAIYNLFKEKGEKNLLLRLTQTMLLLYQGKVMEMFELLKQIEKELDEIEDGSEIYKQYRAELNTLLCYRTYHMEQNHTLCIEQCEYALKNLRPDFIYPRGYAWIFLIGAYQVIGQFKKAEKIAFDQLQANPSEWECSHIWFILCYIYYFENEIDKLKSTAQKLVDFGLENNNKEALANGYFFLGKRYYTIGEWEKAIKYLDKALELGAHTIGIVRVFSTLIKAAAFEKNAKLDHMGKLFNELKEQTFLKGNSMLALYVTGHEAEMRILSGEMQLAKKLINQVPERPLMPVTNNTDPHFAIIKYKIYTNNLEGLNDLLSQYEEYLNSLHNARFISEVICMKVMLAFQQGDKEKANEELFRVLIKTQQAQLVSPFLDSGSLIENLLYKLPENSEIDQRYIELLKTRFRERNENHFHIQMSVREMDILKLFAEKMTNKEIGEKLFISIKTVKNHSNTMFKKLNVKNRNEAAQKALDLNLLDI